MKKDAEEVDTEIGLQDHNIGTIIIRIILLRYSLLVFVQLF